MDVASKVTPLFPFFYSLIISLLNLCSSHFTHSSHLTPLLTRIIPTPPPLTSHLLTCRRTRLVLKCTRTSPHIYVNTLKAHYATKPPPISHQNSEPSPPQNPQNSTSSLLPQNEQTPNRGNWKDFTRLMSLAKPEIVPLTGIFMYFFFCNNFELSLLF